VARPPVLDPLTGQEHYWPVFDITWRWVPRHVWVRLCLTRSPNCDPGHRWLYAGLVRRDVWRLGRTSLVVMRMPRRA
jgi:hypothetical protein